MIMDSDEGGEKSKLKAAELSMLWTKDPQHWMCQDHCILLARLGRQSVGENSE